MCCVSLRLGVMLLLLIARRCYQTLNMLLDSFCCDCCYCEKMIEAAAYLHRLFSSLIVISHSPVLKGLVLLSCAGKQLSIIIILIINLTIMLIAMIMTWNGMFILFILILLRSYFHRCDFNLVTTWAGEGITRFHRGCSTCLRTLITMRQYKYKLSQHCHWL